MKPFYLTLTILGVLLLAFGGYRIAEVNKQWSDENIEMLSEMQAKSDTKSIYGNIDVSESTYHNQKERKYFIEQESRYERLYKSEASDAKFILIVMMVAGGLVALFGGGKLATSSPSSKE